MADAPEVPGGWDTADSGDPPAQLLRRAISHVESLLHRLEHPGDAAESPVGSTPESPPDSAPASAAPPREAAPRHVPAGVTSLPMAAASAEADALRGTLHTYADAHRARAEADGARADAAAESEQILGHARDVSDRLQSESRQIAAELLAAAQQQSAALLTAAEAEAERIRAESARRARADVARAVTGIRDVLVRHVDQLRDSLAAFDASLATLDEPADLARERLDSGLRSVPTTTDGDLSDRRPLGLLFGAPRV